MFGNISKHKILMCYLELRYESGSLMGTPIELELIQIRFINKKKGKKKDFDKYVSSLIMERYISTDVGEKLILSTITNLGASAAADDYFLKKNLGLLGTIARDSLIVICNLAIGIGAIIALNRQQRVVVDLRDNELPLQSQLDTLKLQVQQMSLKLDTSNNLKSHSKPK